MHSGPLEIIHVSKRVGAHRIGVCSLVRAFKIALGVLN